MFCWVASKYPLHQKAPASSDAYMELPQVYAPALKPRQVISLFYSTNMPMETIADESHFDEQGTMVLYSLFVHHNLLPPSRVFYFYIWKHNK